MVWCGVVWCSVPVVSIIVTHQSKWGYSLAEEFGTELPVAPSNCASSSLPSLSGATGSSFGQRQRGSRASGRADGEVSCEPSATSFPRADRGVIVRVGTREAGENVGCRKPNTTLWARLAVPVEDERSPEVFFSLSLSLSLSVSSSFFSLSSSFFFFSLSCFLLLLLLLLLTSHATALPPKYEIKQREARPATRRRRRR